MSKNSARIPFKNIIKGQLVEDFESNIKAYDENADKFCLDYVQIQPNKGKMFEAWMNKHDVEKISGKFFNAVMVDVSGTIGQALTKPSRHADGVAGSPAPNQNMVINVFEHKVS